MFFENKIYKNGELINTITTCKEQAIIKELVNCCYHYKAKPEKLILNNKEYLTFKHYFSHIKADGTKDNYLYDIVFSFNGVEGVNL